MKKIILLVLVFLLVFSTGCSVLDKLVIFGRAVDFFTAWVAHDQEDIEDALTGEVTYNGLTMLKANSCHRFGPGRVVGKLHNGRRSEICNRT